jgi:hypothetical protein
MKVNAHLIIISVDMKENKTYVLSKDKEKITFPSYEINQENKNTFDSFMIDMLIQNVYVENFMINTQPQFITANFDPDNDDQKQDMNMGFGFLTDYTDQIDKDNFWVEFNYMNPQDYNNVLYQTIQRLK